MRRETDFIWEYFIFIIEDFTTSFCREYMDYVYYTVEAFPTENSSNAFYWKTLAADMLNMSEFL